MYNDPFNNSSGTVPFNTYFVNAPEFNFTSNGTNTSVIYQFQITPLNGAGNGRTTVPVTGYFIGRELLLLLLKGQTLTLTDLDETWLLLLLRNLPVFSFSILCCMVSELEPTKKSIFPQILGT